MMMTNGVSGLCRNMSEKVLFRRTLGLVLPFSSTASTTISWETRLHNTSKNLVMGCVSYDPAVGEIWSGIQRYLVEDARVPFDYVLFTNYEAQVRALVKGNIDIAWNGPIAHVLTEMACPPQEEVWSLGMRDVDRDFESIVVVPKNRTSDDLSNKVLLTGSVDSPQAHVVPLYHLQTTLGIPFAQVEPQNYDLGKHGDTAVGEIKAMELLLSTQSSSNQVAVLSRMMWNKACQGQIPSINASDLMSKYEELSCVSLPTFDHCQFDAISNPHKKAQLEDFGQALFAMDGDKNAEHQRLLCLEGIEKEWMEPRQSGYDIVRKAMTGSSIMRPNHQHRLATNFKYASPYNTTTSKRQYARGFSTLANSNITPRVAVIGAGVAGLQALRAFKAAGLNVTALEASDTIGGVWKSNYSNFGVQVPKQLYEFQDFPMTSVPNGKLPTGPQVKSYMEDFVDHFGLRDSIQFNTKVQSAKLVGTSWKLETISASDNSTAKEETYDYLVVATGLYSARNKVIPPPLQNLDNVLHSSDFHDSSVAKGKRVVVVGAGKSAVDCAIESVKAGASKVTIVQRETHWPTPLYIAGIIPFEYIFLSRLGQALVSTHTAPLPDTGLLINAFHKSIIGPLLMKPVFRAVEELFAFQFGMYGPLRPKEDVVRDFYQVGLILDNTFKQMRKSGKIEVVIGEIDEAHQNDKSLKLADGSIIKDVDLIVSGTGFRQDYSIFDEKMKGDIGCNGDDGLYLYRGILPEAVSNLAFLGCVLSASNITTDGLQAEWLARHWTGQITTTPEMMRKDIEAKKKWARSWMPHTSARGNCVLLHQTHYNDQLMKDMGENPHRKMPNILAEMFMPYQTADYNGIIGKGTKAA